MTRSSADVEADVEATRDALDRNVEALKQKMTPGQLFDEAARLMGGTGQQVASKFAEQAKANPMPLAVMGLGLAWLMMSNNRAAQPAYAGAPRSGFGEPMAEGRSFAGEGDGSSVVSRLGETAGAVGDKARSLADGARERLGSAGASVGDQGRSALQSLGHAAGTARDRAGDMGHQAQRTFMDTLEREPLLLAGVGVLVGAAIGAALPHTRVEDRLMGEDRDRLLNKGKSLAQEGMQQAGAAASAAYETVKSELTDEDGADRNLTDRAEDAARSGVQAARDQFGGGPTH